MSSNNHHIIQLLVKRQRGEALTEEEMDQLVKWLETSGFDRPLTHLSTDEQWMAEVLADPRGISEDQVSLNAYVPERWGRRWLRSGVAAVFLILFACGAWLFWRGWERMHPPAADAPHTGRDIPDDAGVVFIGSDDRATRVDTLSVETTFDREGDYRLRKIDSNGMAYEKQGIRARPAGEKQRISAQSPGAAGGRTLLRLVIGRRRRQFHLRLPDGTNVWLAAGSRFSFPSEGREATAPFFLEGEAFFDVVHDPGKPFHLQTPRGEDIQVLGTVFNVEAFKGSQETRVSLFSGLVKLMAVDYDTVVRPGQQVMIREGQPVLRAIADSAGMMSWIGQELFFHFRNTDFNAAISQVASWYGYTLSNPDNVKGTPLTCDLRRDPSPAGLVRQIGYMESGYAYLRLQGHVIQISKHPF